MDNWIELASNQLTKGSTVKAFFYLALEAIKQLTRIADLLHGFDDVVDHSGCCIVTRENEY